MKLFSLEKANALLPIVTPLIERLWSKRRELAIKLLENGGRDTRCFNELKMEVVGLIERIEAHGCLMKDVDLGLLDFPAERAGRQVFLCWKAGEPMIVHWHALNENFFDRKEL